MAGYLLNAVRKDYKENISSVDSLSQKNDREWIQSIESDLKKEQEQQKQREYSKNADKEILEQLSLLSENKREELIKAFRKILPPIFASKYDKDGLSNKACLALFKSFVLEKYSDHFKLTNVNEKV